MNGKPFDEGDAAIEEAHGLLRSWTQGLFRFDEHVQSLKYVIAPDGRLIAPVMVAALQTPDTALYIPDDEAPVLELLLSLEAFEERGDAAALADRWRIHHGTEEDINWAVMGIDMVRISDLVIDGDAIVTINPLADVEAGRGVLLQVGATVPGVSGLVGRPLEAQLHELAIEPLIEVRRLGRERSSPSEQLASLGRPGGCVLGGGIRQLPQVPVDTEEDPVIGIGGREVEVGADKAIVLRHGGASYHVADWARPPLESGPWTADESPFGPGAESCPVD